MKPYLVNIDSSRAEETLLTGQAGRTIKNLVIRITSPDAFTATLTLSRGGKDSLLWSYNMDAGDVITDTTAYIWDQSSTITFSGTTGLSIIFIGEEQ